MGAVGRCVIGRVRKQNEDSIFISDNAELNFDYYIVKKFLSKKTHIPKSSGKGKHNKPLYLIILGKFCSFLEIVAEMVAGIA